MLENVVAVLALAGAEPPAGEGVVAEEGVEVPADLEVDQVRPAVVAEEDVFGLVGVDVGDVAAVDLAEEVVELAFTQASKPVVISGRPAEGATSPGFRYLLMPRRLLS